MPTNASPPTVTGNAGYGQTLSAGVGSWNNSPSQYAYQWQHCTSSGCTNVASNGTGSTYILQATDSGNTMRVGVAAYNGGGWSSTAYSLQTGTVADPYLTAAPLISGTPVDQQTLTSTPGTWAASVAPTYAFQWLRCNAGSCSPITSATAASYTLTPADVGSTIESKVTATGASVQTGMSSQTTTVLANAPTITSPPTVTGTPEQESSLTVTPGSYTGTPPITTAYRWQRCGGGYSTAVLADSPVGFWRLGEASGTTASDSSGASLAGTYTSSGVTYGAAGPHAGDTNTAVRLNGSSGRVNVPAVAMSASAFSVEGWVNTTSTGLAPMFSNAPNINAGMWIGVYGGKALAWTPNHQFAGNAVINDGHWHQLVLTWDGTTARIYVDGAFDASGSLAVSAMNYAGYIGYDNSNYAWFNGAIDDVSIYPTTLTATQISTHFVGCGDIPGATSSTYKLASADVGSTVRVRVTETNSAGTATAWSTQTSTIGPPKPPQATALPAVSGVARDGESLSAAAATWAGTQSITTSRQWQRCVDYAPLVLSDTPLGYWQLGETAGVAAADASGNDFQGTYAGNPVLGAAGAVPNSDTAANFDGVDDTVSIGDQPLFNFGPFSYTVEAWVKTTDTTVTKTIVAKGTSSTGNTARYALWLDATGKLNGTVADGTSSVTATSAGGLADGKWHHVAMTVDRAAGQVTVYVDGTAAGSNPLGTVTGGPRQARCRSAPSTAPTASSARSMTQRCTPARFPQHASPRTPPSRRAPTSPARPPRPTPRPPPTSGSACA